MENVVLVQDVQLCSKNFVMTIDEVTTRAPKVLKFLPSKKFSSSFFIVPRIAPAEHFAAWRPRKIAELETRLHMDT